MGRPDTKQSGGLRSEMVSTVSNVYGVRVTGREGLSRRAMFQKGIFQSLPNGDTNMPPIWLFVLHMPPSPLYTPPLPPSHHVNDVLHSAVRVHSLPRHIISHKATQLKQPPACPTRTTCRKQSISSHVLSRLPDSQPQRCDNSINHRYHATP